MFARRVGFVSIVAVALAACGSVEVSDSLPIRTAAASVETTLASSAFVSPPPSHATPRPTLRPLEVLVAGSPPPATSAEVDKAIVEVLATHAEWAGEPSGWTGLTSGKMVETMWLGCRDLRGEDVDALRERWGHCQSAVAWLSRLYRATASEDAWDAARLLLGFARTNLPTYWYSLLVSVFQ